VRDLKNQRLWEATQFILCCVKKKIKKKIEKSRKMKKKGPLVTIDSSFGVAT
jgi:hypothetical protein